MVLVAYPADEHVNAVERELRTIRVPFVRYWAAQLPEGGIVVEPGETFQIGPDQASGRPMAGLWRRPGQPDVQPYENAFAAFVDFESRDAFWGGLLALQIRWLNHPNALHASERKAVQLAVARTLRIPIPDTVITNLPEVAMEFARAHREVIAKPVRFGLVASEPDIRVAWARVVTGAELSDLKGPPIVLQDRVVAGLHLRVVTVREKVFISTLATDHVDWRSEPTNHEKWTAASAVDWPVIASQAHQIADRLDLGYSSQDWIVDVGGRPVFLELNPNGQWLFADVGHRGAITRAIAHALSELTMEG